MTNIEKFNDTVSILVNAYLNNELEHGNCAACAVGNIIASKRGVKPVLSCEMVANGGRYRFSDGSFPAWIDVFITRTRFSKQIFVLDGYIGEAKEEIDLTGYSVFDLAKIEFAFERALNQDTEERMFEGLMNCVDVLAEIHGVPLTTTESAKQLFVRA